jgi:phosphocarrier protein HPr
MKTQFTFKIKDPLGLHLRPAKDMAQVFLDKAVDVQLTFQSQQVNAKSPLSLLTLAAPCESVMTLEITGDQHREAFESFCSKFQDWMEPVA